MILSFVLLSAHMPCQTLLYPLIIGYETNSVLEPTGSERPSDQDHGSYRQGYVKFKDFSRTSKNLFYSFQGLQVYETY